MTNIIIDHNSIQKKANSAYNELAFIAQALIPKIDVLKETDKPKRQLKKAINDLLNELEKITKEHYENFKNHGEIIAEDGTHESLDIYHITAKAYDELLSLQANDIVILMHVHKELKNRGIDYNKIAIEYEKVLK